MIKIGKTDWKELSSALIIANSYSLDRIDELQIERDLWKKTAEIIAKQLTPSNTDDKTILMIIEQAHEKAKKYE